MGTSTYLFRPIRSYVLRQGRMSKAQQNALIQHWPNYGIDLACLSAPIHTVFSYPSPLVVEIGFGMGDALIDYASHFPSVNFLGIDVHSPGVGHALQLAQQQQLQNLKLCQADAVSVFSQHIAKESLLGVHIFFPDPWPRKRHHKRRLLQKIFIDMIKSCLQPSGYIWVVTDWQDYAYSAKQAFDQVEGLKPGIHPGQALQQALLAHRPQTKYEKRAQRYGLALHELIFSLAGE